MHANGPADTLSRLETLVLLAGIALPLAAVRQQIASAVDAVVFVARAVDGGRRVEAIAELTAAPDQSAARVRTLFARQGAALVAVAHPTRASRRPGCDLEAGERRR